MKDRIRSAQIVLPCADLDRALEFFTGQLGFRLDTIFPADAPSTAVVAGYGLTLRLEKSIENHAFTLHLYGDFAGEPVRELLSPDGVRVRLFDETAAVDIPEAVQEFVVSTLGDADVWHTGRAGMRYRDLLPARLGGRFIASHIRIPTGGTVPDYVHYHKIRFQMIYCLAGWARLVYEDQGESFLMRAGDCVLQPPAIRHRVLECSDAFEVLEIGCPAVHETLAEHKFDLPNGSTPGKSYGGQRFVHHRADRAVWQTSSIGGCEERDTGIFGATGGLADVRVLRTESGAGFTARHSGEFLFFFVTKGNLRLAAENIGAYHLNAGAAVCLPPDAEFQVEAAPGTELVRVRL